MPDILDPCFLKRIVCQVRKIVIDFVRISQKFRDVMSLFLKAENWNSLMKNENIARGKLKFRDFGVSCATNDPPGKAPPTRGRSVFLKNERRIIIKYKKYVTNACFRNSGKFHSNL